ncbi:MAG: outer membrane protein assembly factor BamD [Campylobacterales bacterium]|nr:outer membrane protein assembly factor BamD [Campylobacterales bacterium]
MNFKLNATLAIVLLSILFSGCSKKEVSEYNKPALYWYEKMTNSISRGELEKADSYYSSLQGEHISSPLLPEATMILAIAHMKNEEYLLAEHFLSEYVKRYATDNEKEFADFLKVKSMYMALPNPRRDQALISNTIMAGEKFKRDYPYSMYNGMVNTMLTRLNLGEVVLNETIASLYDRLDKPQSAQYYRDKKPQDWVDFKSIERSEGAWYRSWFEGDGTQSWYSFMIPDTKSVVSRSTVQSDANITVVNSGKSKLEDIQAIEDDSDNSWMPSFFNSWFSEDAEELELKENIKEEIPALDERSSEQLPLD